MESFPLSWPWVWPAPMGVARKIGVLICLAGLGIPQTTAAQGDDIKFVDGFVSLGAGDRVPALAGLPTQTRKAIHFDIHTNTAEEAAFAHQVIAQVQQNLADLAVVASPPDALHPALMGGIDETADAHVDAANTQMAEGDFQGLRVHGTVAYQNGHLIEFSVSITQQASGEPPSARREDLTFRTDISDWQRVAAYLSNTLHSRLTGRPGFYQSQVAFIVHFPTGAVGAGDAPEMPTPGRHGLARTDQNGGGLRWVQGTGDQVAAPVFLSNRFEIAFLTRADVQNRLMHYNILTTRLTYMMTLPELRGAPALAQGGRLVAFSASTSPTSNAESSEETNIYVADVEMGHTKVINIQGSQDRHPQFSPDLRLLSFVSTDAQQSALMIAPVPYTMAVRDRTTHQGQDGQDAMDGFGHGVQGLYSSPHRLHQPAWSPDGQHLVFIEQDGDQARLMHHDLALGHTQPVAHAPHLRDPVWSPDGREVLVVLAAPDDPLGGDLMRLNLAERRMRPFPTPFPVTQPTWSRNGSAGSITVTGGQ